MWERRGGRWRIGGAVEGRALGGKVENGDAGVLWVWGVDAEEQECDGDFCGVSHCGKLKYVRWYYEESWG